MDKNTKPFTVLMAEDDTDDCLIAMQAWEENCDDTDIRFVQDGKELLDYLYHRGKYADPIQAPRPNLILLDLHMPKKDGQKVLTDLQLDSQLSDIPVVVFTNSQRARDMADADGWGAHDFITKPTTLGEYRQVMRDVHDSMMTMQGGMRLHG